MHPSTSPWAPASQRPFGEHLKAWRQQRRWTQLDLAARAEVSARHLSFVETGRAAPSREMVMRLSQCLQVPLRERNQWLAAAGFAPMYREHPLDGEALAAARQAVQRLLTGHEPFPAMAIDRHWNIVAANAAVPVILGGAGSLPAGMRPNVIRGSHHPAAPLSSRIANRHQLRAIHADRLRQQVDASGDPALAELLAELLAYPERAEVPTAAPLASEHVGVAAPFQVHSAKGVLSFLTATTIFGSVSDITLSELSMEIFLPADAFTAAVVPQLVQAAARGGAGTGASG
jgi:transcriptional regulator with XRE-family HTH domain